MRILLLTILMFLQLFAHNIRGVPQDENVSEGLRYGIFADVLYRSDDLYPYGAEGSAGYENHGNPGELLLNHIGFYVDGTYASHWRYGVQVNRHYYSPATFDGLVEELYAGYANAEGSIVAGRNANNISYVRQEPWGYGFAQMPIAIDSFFDGTYYGDGLFLNYRFNDLKLAGDLTKDRYTATPRATFRIAYDRAPFSLIAYIQLRERSEVRVNYASTTHTHSHGNGCDNLTENERCYNRSNTVFGLGGHTQLESLRLQGEYIYLETQGDVYNNRYKVKSHNKINSLYLQAIYGIGALDIGLRSEWFRFSNLYSGNGASQIAEGVATDHANELQYLNTFMVAYRLGHSNKVFLQSENSQDGWAWRFSYILTLDSPF